MTAPKSVDPAGFLREQLESASPDLLRDDGEDVRRRADVGRGRRGLRRPVRASAATSGPTPATATGPGSGTPGPARWSWPFRSCAPARTSRTGCLHHRRRAEQALVSVVATSYLLGVSTRRVEKLVEQLGVASLSKSQVSEMAAHLDAQVEAFRSRPLDAGPYTFVWVRRADHQGPRGRPHGQRARPDRGRCQRRRRPGGPRPGRRLDRRTAPAGWRSCARLTARGLSGVRLVVSDAHRGLVDAIGATLPGAAWQRCRTHYLRNLLTKVPKSAQPWVATMVRTIFDQPDAAAVRDQFGRVVDTIAARVPRRGNTSRRRPRRPAGVRRRSRTRSGVRSGPTTRKSG